MYLVILDYDSFYQRIIAFLIQNFILSFDSIFIAAVLLFSVSLLIDYVNILLIQYD